MSLTSLVYRMAVRDLALEEGGGVKEREGRIKGRARSELQVGVKHTSADSQRLIWELCNSDILVLNQ